MEQRVSLITLGVDDVGRSKAFYEALGWRGQEVEETVFFQAGSIAVVLWGRQHLADDAGAHEVAGSSQFGGIALAQNVRSPEEVDECIAAGSAGVRSPAGPSRRSMAATPGTSLIQTGTAGRLLTIPALPSLKTAPWYFPTSR